MINLWLWCLDCLPVTVEKCYFLVPQCHRYSTVTKGCDISFTHKTFFLYKAIATKTESNVFYCERVNMLLCVIGGNFHMVSHNSHETTESLLIYLMVDIIWILNPPAAVATAQKHQNLFSLWFTLCMIFPFSHSRLGSTLQWPARSWPSWLWQIAWRTWKTDWRA